MEIIQAQFIMAVRERTTLNEYVFKRMPGLKLVLQTGGHAYHIDTSAAKKQHIIIALGRRVKAPLISVPELTFAFALSLMHKVHQGNSIMHNGQWELLTGRTRGNSLSLSSCFIFFGDVNLTFMAVNIILCRSAF